MLGDARLGNEVNGHRLGVIRPVFATSGQYTGFRAGKLGNAG